MHLFRYHRLGSRYKTIVKGAMSVHYDRFNLSGTRSMPLSSSMPMM